MSKVPLVLFSGGLDSTYLMYKHAKEGRQTHHMYLTGGQTARKIECESEAREKILKYFYEHYPKACFSEHRGSNEGYPVTLNFANGYGVSWSQSIAWLICALGAVNPDRHSSVQVSYVLGDQALQLIETMQTAWKALWTMAKLGELVPLEFPLKHTTKYNIMQEMPRELYKLTWVCETPRGLDGERQPCGTCYGCETRALEEIRFKMRDGRSYLPEPEEWAEIKDLPSEIKGFSPSDLLTELPNTVKEEVENA